MNSDIVNPIPPVRGTAQLPPRIRVRFYGHAGACRNPRCRHNSNRFAKYKPEGNRPHQSPLSLEYVK